MERFINENFINKNEVNYFQKLIDELENNNIDGAFFGGFPFLEISGESRPIRGMIVCEKGIFLCVIGNEEKKLYRRNATKILMDGEEISEIIFDNPEAIDFFDYDQDIFDVVK